MGGAGFKAATQPQTCGTDRGDLSFGAISLSRWGSAQIAGCGPVSKPDSEGSLFEVALAIAQEHSASLEQMRAALERGDDSTALRFARELCGLKAHPGCR